MPELRTGRHYKAPPKKCEHCNSLFIPRSDKVKHSKGGRFCSRKCSFDFQTENKKPTEVRFWNNIVKLSEDECWPYMSMHKSGYGVFNFEGKMVRAHRVAYYFSKGDIPSGLLIRHTCDNRICCNPKHLIIGTYEDNMQDMRDRNRHLLISGENHYLNKLTNNDVIAIKKEYLNSKPSYASVARKYKVNYNTISDIVKGITWKHIKIEEYI